MCKKSNTPQTNPGYKQPKKLLSNGSTNAKTIKNKYKTYILYMMPSTGAGQGINVCPFASPECIALCLNTAGMGIFSNVQQARTNKTLFWSLQMEEFYKQLAKEITAKNKTANRLGIYIAIRLNGTSDLPHIDLLKRFTGIDVLSKEFKRLKFYDYTKSPKLYKQYQGTKYKLTFSRSETNEAQAINVLQNGGNVAVVFKDKLPSQWHGFKVINGDKTDLRYNDPKNVVIGLIAKGKAKKGSYKFVVNS